LLVFVSHHGPDRGAWRTPISSYSAVLVRDVRRDPSVEVDSLARSDREKRAYRCVCVCVAEGLQSNPLWRERGFPSTGETSAGSTLTCNSQCLTSPWQQWRHLGETRPGTNQIAPVKRLRAVAVNSQLNWIRKVVQPLETLCLFVCLFDFLAKTKSVWHPNHRLQTRPITPPHGEK